MDVDSLKPLWGARQISKLINRDVRATYHALERNEVPGARKVCGRWMLLPRAFYLATGAMVE